MFKIEEGMKNMFVNGNNAIHDLYSKFDQIGDFSNKAKFRNPVKEEQKQQSQPIYIQSPNKVDTKSYSQSYYQRVTKPKNEAKKMKKKEQIFKEEDIIKDLEQQNNLNKDIITQSKIFDLSKKLKDEQKQTEKLKKTNLNKDIINQSKIFQLNKNLKDEKKETRKHVNLFMQSQFEVDRLSKNNENVNSSWMDEQLDNDIDTSEKFI